MLYQLSYAPATAAYSRCWVRVLASPDRRGRVLSPTTESRRARGRSSAGRASGLHPEGQGFEPPRLQMRPLKRHPRSTGTKRRNQYVVTLSGTLEFTTRDGEVFVLHPGDVLLAADDVGTGHKWRLLDDRPWRRLYAILADQT
jgi:hypothetical protein